MLGQEGARYSFFLPGELGIGTLGFDPSVWGGALSFSEVPGKRTKQHKETV